MEQVTCTSVRDFNLTEKGYRAGIVLFYVENDSLYFVFGYDRKTHELTDFAGGLLPTDRSMIDTAIREFDEESLGIFDKLTYEKLLPFKLIYDSTNLIIFVRITKQVYEKKRDEFQLKYKECNNPNKVEICGIESIRWEIVRDMILINHDKKNTNTILYERVREFMYRGNIHDSFHVEKNIINA